MTIIKKNPAWDFFYSLYNIFLKFLANIWFEIHSDSCSQEDSRLSDGTTFQES